MPHERIPWVEGQGQPPWGSQMGHPRQRGLHKALWPEGMRGQELHLRAPAKTHGHRPEQATWHLKELVFILEQKGALKSFLLLKSDSVRLPSGGSLWLQC